MLLEWNKDKDEFLKQERGISFADIALEIAQGRYDIKPNSSRLSQMAFIVRLTNLKHPVYVPAVPTAGGYFLKTAYQSRKETKKLQNFTFKGVGV